MPLDTPGIKVEKMLPVFGFDDAPHGHAQVLLENVRVPASNILLGEGRGFEIAQGRLGPGRIHHCMRTIGKAEEALEKMVRRLSSRTAFGKKIIEYSIWEQRIAEARTDIEMNRLAVPEGRRHDGQGRQQDRAARDRHDQGGGAQHGAEDHRQRDPGLWRRPASPTMPGSPGTTPRMRTLRLADGPDEVHNRAIARLELRKYANAPTTH